MSRVVVPPNSLSGSASPPGTGLNLRWRPLIRPRNAATYPAATLNSDCGRGLAPKDAASMGRGDKPLLDFSSKEHSIGGITMHPLRKLRESGKPTPAQVSELLAENIVFNSPILVRPIEGRQVIRGDFRSVELYAWFRYLYSRV